jgi:hypothetical protein
MRKEWTEIELQHVLHTVRIWINTRKFETLHHGKLKHIGTVAELDKILGLPYTSSGRAACVGICNTELYLDNDRKYTINSFEMDYYGIIYAVCFDKDENELLIPINK